MNSPRVVAVVGATGAQGGGLVDALLADSEGGFAPRALTRDPSSEAARALSDRGVEVVRADLNDRSSLEEAFAGAYGAFCVTNFWELFDPEKEMAQARNLAEACAHAGVQHAIWSTLEDTREFVPLSDDRMPTLLGRYKVPHFDGKGEANSYFADAGVPTTYLLASFYWENFIYFGLGPKPGPEGELTLTIPMADAPLAGIGAEDIGPCAYGLFKTEAIGETVGIALRSKARTNPLIISAGHKIDLPTAVHIVQTCLRGYRLPEPTRRAHNLAGQAETGDAAPTAQPTLL